jgi:hypothetical protein
MPKFKAQSSKQIQNPNEKCPHPALRATFSLGREKDYFWSIPEGTGGIICF